MNTLSTGGENFHYMLNRFRLQRGFAFGVLIVAALLAFEVFNYSTTDFALADLLGAREFAGVRWATILAIAFCGIDFAGIARLFTPEQGSSDQMEVWYLFGAWMLAATMNAMLTWWGVSLAILNHETIGNAVVERQTLLRVVPIFVAIMVWLIRVLIIGTFSVAGDRLFSQASTSYRPARYSASSANARSLVGSQRPAVGSQARASIPATASFRSSARSLNQPEPAEEVVPEPANQRSDNGYRNNGVGQIRSGYNRPEPTYHPAVMSGRTDGSNSQTRR
jgi:hypothetical protein